MTHSRAWEEPQDGTPLLSPEEPPPLSRNSVPVNPVSSDRPLFKKFRLENQIGPPESRPTRTPDHRQ